MTHFPSFCLMFEQLFFLYQLPLFLVFSFCFTHGFIKKISFGNGLQLKINLPSQYTNYENQQSSSHPPVPTKEKKYKEDIWSLERLTSS